MTAARPANRRIDSRLIWATIAAAVAVHGALIGTSQALGLSLLSHPPTVMGSPEPQIVPEEQVELALGCNGDSYLATVGRVAMCFGPWSGDRAECANEAEMQMYLDLSSCMARNEPAPTSIAMVPATKELEKLPQIDPEKLIDEGKQQEEAEPPKPPPIPQLQQQQQPPPPPPPPPPQRPAQVVETAKPNEESKEPENAKYLAEYNTVAEKQKVNRGARNEPMVAKAKPEELSPKDKPKDDPSTSKPQTDDPPGKITDAPPAPNTMAMRKPAGTPQPEQKAPQEERVQGSTGGAKGPAVADGYMGRKGDGAIEQQRREREEEKVSPKGQNGGGGGSPPNLKLSKEQAERALGGGNVDRVEDADDSDETSLTAKRFVYASFFNRLKRQVAQNWEPAGVWRRVDPQGTVYGFKTRITEVRVTLAPNGVLDKIVVTQASGVGELDDEAVRAFRSAAPFPNPPDGLVKDGKISFAFSFYFEIGQPRSSWRVIRSM